MKAESPATPRWRYLSVCCVLIGLAGMLMGRLVMLQVTEEGQGANFLREQGAMRTVRTAEIPVYRGLIEDRHQIYRELTNITRNLSPHHPLLARKKYLPKSLKLHSSHTERTLDLL